MGSAPVLKGVFMKVRLYTEKDLPAMVEIWNEIIEDGSYVNTCPYYIELV